MPNNRQNYAVKKWLLVLFSTLYKSQINKKFDLSGVLNTESSCSRIVSGRIFIFYFLIQG